MYNDVWGFAKMISMLFLVWRPFIFFMHHTTIGYVTDVVDII